MPLSEAASKCMLSVSNQLKRYLKVRKQYNFFRWLYNLVCENNNVFNQASESSSALGLNGRWLFEYPISALAEFQSYYTHIITNL